MTLAHHDIERQVADAVPSPDQHMARVLVVATTPAITRAMMQEMAQDGGVRGLTDSATLAEVMIRNRHNWSTLDFVVFEISESPETDMDAVRELLARDDATLHCVAVTDTPITPAMTARFKDAGVAEVITVERADDMRADTENTAAATDNLFAEAPEVEPPVTAKAPPPAPNAPTNPGLPRSRRTTQGQLTVVLRARGGAGATTLAVNLAVAQAGRAECGTTALVDLDIQSGAVAMCMDLPDSAEASAFIKGTKRATRDFLDTAMVPHSSGVDVLTAPDIFAPISALDPTALEELLSVLKDRYDHVVLDMPQGIDAWINPVLSCADRVLIVTDTSLPAVKRTRRLMDLIAEEHMTLPVQVAVNQQKKPLFMSTALKECEALIGRPLTHWIPMDVKTARRASDLGVPLQTGAKRSGMARAIARLGQSIFTAPRTS